MSECFKRSLKKGRALSNGSLSCTHDDCLWERCRENIFSIDRSETEWKKIKISKIGSQVFVEFLIWTKPFGEAEVQDLNWYVYRVESQKLTLITEHTVQKRSRDFNSNEASYKYDKSEEFKLYSKKGVAYIRFKGKGTKVK